MRGRIGSIARSAFAPGWRSALVVALLAAVSFAATTGPEAENPLPRLGRVADFTLHDQSGSAVSRASLSGEPWIASFFFTRCPTVCPLLMRRMQRLERIATERDAAVRLVSITVDPDHDRSAVLQAYADSWDAGWSMLTGTEDDVKSLARSLAVAMEGEADPDELNYGILHSGHLVLVDGQGTVRGYYRSGDDDVETRILADARRLHEAR